MWRIVVRTASVLTAALILAQGAAQAQAEPSPGRGLASLVPWVESVEVVEREDVRSWTLTVGADVVALEETRQSDGGRTTGVIVNGRFVEEIAGGLLERETLEQVDRALARGLGQANADGEELEAEASTRTVIFDPCAGYCIPCWNGWETVHGLTVATTALCISGPSLGCTLGAAMTTYLTSTTVDHCRRCHACWNCLLGDMVACRDLETGGPGSGDSGDDGLPGRPCPTGTHEGPTTECGGVSPCCCTDHPPHICYPG